MCNLQNAIRKTKALTCAAILTIGEDWPFGGYGFLIYHMHPRANRNNHDLLQYYLHPISQLHQLPDKFKIKFSRFRIYCRLLRTAKPVNRRSKISSVLNKSSRYIKIQELTKNSNL
jgi:hypothetical protein